MPACGPKQLHLHLSISWLFVAPRVDRQPTGRRSQEQGCICCIVNPPASCAAPHKSALRCCACRNPQIDLQAQARAHRLGQRSDVLVLRLATANSIEDRVMSTAAQKRSLADRSITGG